MKRWRFLLTICVFVFTFGYSASIQASFFSYPHLLQVDRDRVRFDKPSLAPMAFFAFCLRYPEDCEERKKRFRMRPVMLTEKRWSDLVQVNLEVNRSITPQANAGGVLNEEWVLSPSAGDCNDYAVTKRHELLSRGWPSRALLLAEVVIPSGEHHLVLVVSTRDGDLILDNLNSVVQPVSKANYRWIRAQTGTNPKFWSEISVPPSVKVASISVSALRSTPDYKL